MRGLLRSCRCGLGLLLVSSLVWANSGCSRSFFRKQADQDVSQVLSDKDVFPQWKLENMHAYPDPRARFADPTNPDRPPMPPDDPAAKFLGPTPQRPPHHGGVSRVEGEGYVALLEQWDAQNRAEKGVQAKQTVQGDILQASFLQDKKPDVLPDLIRDKKPEELPAPRVVDDLPRVVDTDANGKRPPYRVKYDQAVELALINSREYQTRREDVYLAALPVTRERFAFGPQFLALGEAIRERTGENTPLGRGDRWQAGGTLGASKLFSTGALLLFSFANQTAVELTNPANKRISSTSFINLDFIQPLLRGGGRAVTLEPLTLAERNLLYEIRSYARFRRQYYQYLIGGSVLPSYGRTGIGSLNGATLLSAVSNSNQARSQISPSGAGTLFLGQGGTSPSPDEGFLSNVFKRAVVELNRQNVVRFKKVVELFEAYESGGEVSSLQVGQIQLSLLNSQSQVLTSEQDSRDSLDRFKLQLGLPLFTPIELDDQQFQPVISQFEKFDKAIADGEAAVKEFEKLDNLDQPAMIRAGMQKLVDESPLTKSAPQFRKQANQRWERWRKDYASDKAVLEELEKLRTERRKLLDQKDVLEEKEQSLSEKDAARLKAVEGNLSIGELEYATRRYETAPWELEGKDKAKREVRSGRWRDLRNAFILVLGEASNERLAQLRPAWPKLPGVVVDGVDLSTADLEQCYDVATRTAIENRLDLMNARAQLVDAWRQVAVFANGLLGTFNVAYHLDSSTPPDFAKPLAFQPANTRNQLVMNLELPLVRVAERNAYRASLIAYQRARRALQEVEDRIVNDVRSEVRQLQVLAQTFKINQQAVELQYLQVESALETFRQPQAAGGAGSNSGSAAALTQQLNNAYSALPRVQQQLLKNWLDYQVGRQQLQLDLELMTLDARGVWIDEQPAAQPRSEPAAAPAAPGAALVPRNGRAGNDVAQRLAARASTELVR